MKLDGKSVEIWLTLIRDFFKVYQWLAEAFVLDHFVNSYWEKLPQTWRDFLIQLQPSQLGQWIITGNIVQSGNVTNPAPLALQGLRRTAQILSVDRRYRPRRESESEKVITDKLRKLLNLHVKPKKRHEIWEMAFLIQDLAVQNGGLKNVVDIGSGVGHLCRFLSYGLGFQTMGIDSNAELGVTAKTINDKIEKELEKLRIKQIDDKRDWNQFCGISEKGTKSEHVSKLLEAEDKIAQDYEFGLVGLHGCGDLGGIIVRNFVQNPQVKFLSFASCCYMKINHSYPLSNFLMDNPINLGYAALELACHAKEVYMQRLSDPAQVDKLKTHCYRATLETILIKKGFIKEGLKSVKKTHTLSFREYAMKASEKLPVQLSAEELDCESNERLLADWMKVVCFYTLRVVIAPVIETAVLLDRALFVLENGFSCELHASFDPVQSPRNVVIIGKK